jgi:hypothetical protein
MNEVNCSESGDEGANLTKLLCCPFCGSEAGIKSEAEEFQIIGCITPPNISMLCPSPSITAYKKEDGGFDYTFWNKRAS